MQALEAKLDALQNGDILILAGSIPASLAQTTYERLLARLEGRGVRAVVDATRDLLVNVLPFHPFLIKPNNHELGEIVGRVLNTEDEIVAAARTLQEKGARNVLVSRAKPTASAARKAKWSTASARVTAWWQALWQATCRAAITPPPSAWAPPAAAPRRSAWGWRRKKRSRSYC